MKTALWLIFFVMVIFFMSKKKPIPKGLFFNKEPIYFDVSKLRWLSAYLIALVLVVLVANLGVIAHYVLGQR